MAIMNFDSVDQSFCGLSLSGDEADRSSSDDEKCVHDCLMDSKYSPVEHATCNSLTELCVVDALGGSHQVFINKWVFIFFGF